MLATRRLKKSQEGPVPFLPSQAARYRAPKSAQTAEIPKTSRRKNEVSPSAATVNEPPSGAFQGSVHEGPGPPAASRSSAPAKPAARASRHGVAGADLAAEVSVAAWPGRVFRGRLDRLGGTLDEATRTATVRVVAPNPDGLLRPGMFARVRLLLPGGATSLAVPEEAVLADEGRSFVFVRANADCFVRRPVAPGRAAGGWIEIASGLREGQAVVARGAFLLKSDVLRAKMGAGCAD